MYRNSMRNLALTALVLLLVSVAFVFGFSRGKNHVIYNADIFCVDYDGEAVYLEIDGQVHEYTLYIG